MIPQTAAELQSQRFRSDKDSDFAASRMLQFQGQRRWTNRHLRLARDLGLPNFRLLGCGCWGKRLSLDTSGPAATDNASLKWPIRGQFSASHQANFYQANPLVPTGLQFRWVGSVAVDIFGLEDFLGFGEG